MTNRTVSVELLAKVQGLVAGLSTGKKAVQDFSGELTKLGSTHKESFNKLATSTTALGLGLVGAFGLAAKSAMDFDKEMSAVASVSNASGKSLDALRAAALQAGKDTAFSATQAAQAEEELAKAGISTSDILGGALAGSLSLAAAGQMDLADAATISAQAMNIFHLQGSAVPHIADVLAASANKSAADMQGMGESLKQGGLVASQFGLTLEDTVGTLSAFADNALIGSDAGTSLKTMLQALANPSQKSADEMKALGINAYNAKGQFVGIADLAGQLQTTLGGLTQAERDQALAQIFGSDAMRAANVLYTQGATGIEDYINSVNDSGAASETARQKMNNLSGDVEQLKGSIETLAIQAGGGGSSGLRLLAQGANAAVTEFIGLPPIISETGTVLAGVGGASLLAGAGFLKARQSGQEFISVLSNMGPVGAKAAGVLSTIGKFGGALGLASVVGFASVEGIKALVDLWSRSLQPIRRDVNALTDSLSRFATEGRITGELAKVIGNDFDSWAQHVVQVGNAEFWASMTRNAKQMQELSKPVKQINSDFKDMDTALTGLVQNGDAQQAKAAFDQINDSLIAAGATTESINEQFPKYIAAAGQAAAANTPLAHGFGNVAANVSLMTRGLQDAIDHGLTLKDVFEQLDGAAEDSARAQIDFKQSISDLTESFKHNGKSLDDNTQKGRDNLSAVLDSIDAAQKAAEAKYNETGSVQAASDMYNAYISQLRKTLSQAGLTKAQIDQLINTYGQIPPAIATSVNTPGLANAVNTVKTYKQQLQDINGKTYTATVKIVTHGDTSLIAGTGVRYRRWGGIRYAADGLIGLGQADTFAPGAQPLYGFAEADTGGEAFVPRFGNYARSTSILDQAARWYGGRFVAGGSAVAAAPVVNVAPPKVDVYIGDENITSRVRVVVHQELAGVAGAVSGGVRP